ncbi:glycosyltransferase [Pseudoalteromonas shioyasakiensis]|uniref:glycosyltransferase family 2 protein n=1 Tax=Pseudoalteromonas shioyasakiensis TaxID=1190813 RepID=UPI0021177134|nr:glycosyltransferase family 2 protein [Pseudoalteromonas shioyasakiensis]MCQ8881299.1 glycosyltransferase [Pseudoalteromonas shioyasakiensis]
MSLVSIITPSYKSKKFIKETLLSIQNQTFTDFEVLIVDDASPDDSADYIEAILPDDRFRLIRLENNLGAAEARNEALKIANGRYIAFLDSDDLWKTEKLEKQIQFMKRKNIAFSFSAYEVIDEKGIIVKDKIPVPDKITKSQYLGNTIIGCLTVILDRTKFKQDIRMPNLRSSHDMALWVNLLDEIKVAHGYKDILASYRLVGTSNTANKTKAAKEVWQVYRNYLQYNRFKSSYYFIKYAFNAVLKRI